MKQLFKAAAGLMSTLVLAAGAGSAANICSTCPQTEAQQSLCETSTDCSSEKLGDVLGCTGSTDVSDVLSKLIENGVCDKNDLRSLIEKGGCTLDDISCAADKCSTDCDEIIDSLSDACFDPQSANSCSTASCDDKTELIMELLQQAAGEQQTESCGDNVISLPKENEPASACSSNTQSCSEAPANDTEEKKNTEPSCNEKVCSDKQVCVDIQACGSDSENCSTECSKPATDCSNEDKAENTASQNVSSECKDTDCNDTGNSCGRNTSVYRINNISDIFSLLGIDPQVKINENNAPAQEEEPLPISDTEKEFEEKPEKETPAPNDSADSDIAAYSVSPYEEEVVNLVNEIRRNYGLNELKLNLRLSETARMKSQDMHDKGYFSHTSPTYGSPFDMMKQFGISYRTAGENIAMGQRTPQEVVDGWMNSEGHRKNILNPDFTEIGVGYVESGRYWTQMFIG